MAIRKSKCEGCKNHSIKKYSIEMNICFDGLVEVMNPEQDFKNCSYWNDKNNNIKLRHA